jgi:hypothetical protein
MALPSSFSRHASIEYSIQGKGQGLVPVQSTFQRGTQTWPINVGRPRMPGIVVYVRIDGGFSVWDPARNYWRATPGRPAAYQFNAADVWDGLDIGDQRVCEGLERDWVIWQEGRREQFTALEALLRELSPPGEPITAGQPRRVFLDDGRDRPTLLFGKQTVPVVLASAGVRRILALAYMLVWAWTEHRVAAGLLGKRPDNRFVILFDEPETHLHPRWQRTIVPSVLTAVNALGAHTGPPPQVLIATHSPLVAASLEPLFDEAQDDLIHLDIRNGQPIVEQGGWAAQGDATNWLVSETFGLEQARSLEAERAIEEAEAFMRGETYPPYDLNTGAAIHRNLQRLLPAHDTFWPRWLVTSGQLTTTGDGHS